MPPLPRRLVLSRSSSPVRHVIIVVDIIGCCYLHDLPRVEVLLNGKHTIERSREAHMAAYAHLFHILSLHRADYKGLILKASFVVPGDESGQKVTPEQVAEHTLHVLSSSTSFSFSHDTVWLFVLTQNAVVPPAVAGIVFLSGGLTDSNAIQYLNAVNLLKQKDPSKAPWPLTFSYGRALQGTAMKVWAKGDIKEAQKV
jgi:fructose-bisphosphate aldolase, class I